MKKITASLVALTMAASLSMTAMAYNSGEESQVEPRAAACTRCDTGRILTRTEKRGWETYRITTYCEHGFPKGTDRYQRRDVYLISECDTCGYSAKVEQEPEERVVCYGKDRSVAVEGTILD